MGLPKAKLVATLLSKGYRLTIEAQPSLTNPDRYRRLIGHLLYLNFTWLDITHVVQQLSQFVHASKLVH